MTRYFSVAGWLVASEVDLPALPAAGGPAEVTIAHVPDRPAIDQPILTDEGWAVGAREWLVRVWDEQVIKVEDGRAITLWDASGAKADRVQLFLPGAAFAVTTYLRGKTPLHGAAIEIAGSAMLLLGASGAGKSTLAAALTAAGYLALADDLCVPMSESGRPLLHPVFPRLRGYPDTLDAFGLCGEPLPDGKRRLPLPESLTAGARPIGGIVVLDERRGSEGRIRRLRGTEAIEAVMRQRWAPQCAGWYGCQASSFRDIGALAAGAGIFAVSTPQGFGRLPAFCDRLIDAVMAGMAAAPR